jgi:hypothetical protein
MRMLLRAALTVFHLGVAVGGRDQAARAAVEIDRQRPRLYQLPDACDGVKKIQGSTSRSGRVANQVTSIRSSRLSSGNSSP